MTGVKEKPLRRPALLENAPAACKVCKAPFDAAAWPRSKWTLSGWSPWCPQHDKALAGNKPWKSKPGPKPKGARGGWTNMPIN